MNPQSECVAARPARSARNSENLGQFEFQIVKKTCGHNCKISEWTVRGIHDPS